MKFGLLGRKLGHSYSPQIHALMGSYSYDLYEREPEEIEPLLRNPEVGGLNVTIPYKKDVIPYLDCVDELSARLGSVNTVVRDSDGTLHGYNSDYFGFRSMVEHSKQTVAHKKVLILGTGGASATVSAVMEDLLAEVTIISRTGENNYQNLDRHRDAQIIVNTTPVGMYPNTGSAPLDITRFPRLEYVYDLIYNPQRTQLLLDCETHGIPACNGLWMLVAQAKQSAEYFMGRTLPDELIQSIHRSLQCRMSNIVLVGMAGSGKTTIGKLAAQKCGKTFVDADEELVKQAGRSIPEIFSQDGEAAFRNMETQILSEFGRQSGLVIATGGDCVTQKRNYPLLHQNGTILWIQRAPDELPTEGRPLSIQTPPARLYEQRKPLYHAFSDKVIVNDTTCEDAAEKIHVIWEDSHEDPDY